MYHKRTKDWIALTDKEIDILKALSQAQDHCVDRSLLLQQVWGYDNDIDTHTLETHIYRLRCKIEKDPTKPKYLLTTQNSEYKLCV